MIDKQHFINFITSFQKFEQGVNRFDQAITGKLYPTILFETDWYNEAAKLLDIFLESYFTEAGCELISWWMFEEVDHIIFEAPNLFSNGKDVEHDVNNIEDLWEFLINNKETYCK